jgi:hypothetical protein
VIKIRYLYLTDILDSHKHKPIKKVKVKVTLQQATKAQRGSRGIPYSFFNLGATSWWVVNVTSRPLYPRERDPVPII